MKNSLIKLSYRSILIIISAIFIFAGVDKIIIRPEMSELFRTFGLPNEFMVIVGFTELVLGMMVQAKYFTKLSLHGMIFILSFAVLLHLLNHQYFATLLPLSIISMIMVTLNLGQKVRNMPK